LAEGDEKPAEVSKGDQWKTVIGTRRLSRQTSPRTAILTSVVLSVLF